MEREREREREEKALIITALINRDEDHESDHIILHHGNSYDNDFYNEERCDVMRQTIFPNQHRE